MSYQGSMRGSAWRWLAEVPSDWQRMGGAWGLFAYTLESKSQRIALITVCGEIVQQQNDLYTSY